MNNITRLSPSNELNSTSRQTRLPWATRCQTLANGKILRSAVLAALAVGTGTVVAGDPQFSAPTDFAVGTLPRAAVFADLNRDGRLDLISAEFQSDQVSVRLGLPGVSFAAPTAYPVGSRPWNVAAGDVNGDGRQDVVTVNCNSNNVSVLIGNIRGGLGTKTDYPLGGACPKGVTIADLNRDGRPDLAVAVAGSEASPIGQINVLLGIGGSRFGTATAIADVAESTTPVFVAATDTNRDGVPDLIAADAAGNAILVLRGQGDGSFQLHATYPVGTNPQQLAVADIDKDGVQDVVTANEKLPQTANGSVSVLTGKADGSFDAAVPYSPGLKIRSVILADTDADGKLDIVTGNGLDAKVSIMPGNGDGSFGLPVSFPAGEFTNGVAAADLNQDGRPEIAAVNQNANSVSILTNLTPTPPAGAWDRLINRGAGTAPSFVATSDLNGDGVPDAVVANQASNDLSVLKGIRDSRVLGRPTPVALPAGITAPTFVTVADINRDGKKDLAVAATGGMTLMTGNGDGSFEPGRSFTDRSVAAVAIRDIDGNDTPDLVTANPAEDTVTVYRQRTNGTYLAAATYAVGDEPVSVKLADLNFDGRPDIAVANRAGNTVSILLQTRTWTFAPDPTGLAVSSSPRAMEIADFNADGRWDIVVVNHDSSDLSVLLGLRRGGFAPARNYALGAKGTGLAVADVNRDGRLDLAVSSDDGAAARLRVLYGRPRGTFSRTVGIRAGQILPWVTSGDFNGDGSPDLLVANGPGNLVSALLNK